MLTKCLTLNEMQLYIELELEKSFVQIFLWELLEYFVLSAKKFWKELTVNLKINHEGLLGEGLQCADIFTSVPDDNRWINEGKIKHWPRGKSISVPEPSLPSLHIFNDQGPVCRVLNHDGVSEERQRALHVTCHMCSWHTWGPRRMSCCPVWAGPWWCSPCPQTRTQ